MSLHMDNRNSNAKQFNSSLDLLLKYVVVTLLWDEWNWSHVEKLITLVIKFLVCELLDVNFAIGEVLIRQILINNRLKISQALGLVIITSLEEGVKSSVLIVVISLGSFLFGLELCNSISSGSVRLLLLLLESSKSIGLTVVALSVQEIKLFLLVLFVHHDTLVGGDHVWERLLMAHLNCFGNLL